MVLDILEKTADIRKVYSKAPILLNVQGLLEANHPQILQVFKITTVPFYVFRTTKPYLLMKCQLGMCTWETPGRLWSGEQDQFKFDFLSGRY